MILIKTFHYTVAVKGRELGIFVNHIESEMDGFEEAFCQIIPFLVSSP